MHPASPGTDRRTKRDESIVIKFPKTAIGGPKCSPRTTRPMSESSAYPRLCNPAEPATFAPAGIPLVCQPLTAAFQAATGWVLDFEESRSSYRRRKADRLPESAADGRLQITDLATDLSPGKPAASREHCDQLAAAISTLYHQLQQHRDELRFAQTQLAVPGRVAISKDRTEKLNRLLTQLLQTACTQFGYDSAAIMVLDEATTTLVQRIGFGPHYQNTNGNSRPLEQGKADIEALSGGVVVLNSRSEVAAWQAPVKSRAAVCIPIASLDNLHGTLWLAGETKRELTDSDTNLLEIIAGRIAAELETAALLAHQSTGAPVKPLATNETPPADAVEDTQDWLPVPFDGWDLERPQPVQPTATLPTLAVSQVDVGENLQVLVACSRNADAAELRLARQAFAVLRGLELDAAQLFQSLNHFLHSESATESELRFACIKLDPLSGEFECHGHPEIRANLSLPGQTDTCVHSRRFGFLSNGSCLRVHCNDCSSDLLVLRRK